LSKSLKDAIKEEYKNGLTILKIAASYGLTPNTVYAIVKK